MDRALLDVVDAEAICRPDRIAPPGGGGRGMLSRSWRGPSPLSAHDPRELGGYALDTVIVERAAGGNAKIFHGVAADGTEASVTLLLGEETACTTGFCGRTTSS